MHRIWTSALPLRIAAPAALLLVLTIVLALPEKNVRVSGTSILGSFTVEVEQPQAKP
jgi:hypothetical protein